MSQPAEQLPPDEEPQRPRQPRPLTAYDIKVQEVMQILFLQPNRPNLQGYSRAVVEEAKTLLAFQHVYCSRARERTVHAELVDPIRKMLKQHTIRHVLTFLDISYEEFRDIINRRPIAGGTAYRIAVLLAIDPRKVYQ